MDDKIPLGRVKWTSLSSASDDTAVAGEEGKEKEREDDSKKEKEDLKREKEDVKREGPVKDPLLPRTSNRSELWPLILTKAILKVAALE